MHDHGGSRYCADMAREEAIWVAPTGLRGVDPRATHTDVPVDELARLGFSFEAIGIYGEVLSYQGVPVQIFAGERDQPELIRSAVEELVAWGYLTIVEQP